MQITINSLFKRVVPALFAVAFVAAGVAGMSAFEAHVINVTAHIENALAVTTQAIDFGTVFPQESLVSSPFTVALSDSFKAVDQNRMDEVAYKIQQKPKCQNRAGAFVLCQEGVDPDNPTKCLCPADTTTVPDLCRFLSKNPTDGEIAEDTKDTGVASYFIPGSPASCATPNPEIALGQLDRSEQDISDNWTVDLKVPPVEGNVGQDWPASCASYTVPTSGATYGCDLWVEVTGIFNHDELPATGILVVKKSIIGDEDDQPDEPEFSFQVNGGSAIQFEADGQNDLTENVGTYTVTETVNQTNCTPSYNNCTSVSVVAGQTTTCTITNTCTEEPEE